MSSDSTSPEATPNSPAKIRVGRLIAIVLFVFVFFTAVILFFGFFDGIGWVRTLTRPPLAAAKGTITLDGQPMTYGHLMTKPPRGGRGSLGVIDSNGQFVLRTDVDGTYQDGAEVGTHKVVVYAQQSGVSLGAAAAPSIVDSKFTSFDTTPLSIEVTSDPSRNVYSLSAQGSGVGTGTPPAAEDKSTSNSRRAEASPAAIVLEQRLPGVDEDDDGKYTREELLKAKSKVLNSFASIDLDGNGIIEGGELDQLVAIVPVTPEATSP